MAGEPTVARNLARAWWHREEAAAHRLATFAPCAADPSHRIDLLDGFLCDPQAGEALGPKLVCIDCFMKKEYRPWTGWPELTARYQSKSKDPSPVRTLVILMFIVAGGTLGVGLNGVLPPPVDAPASMNARLIAEAQPLLSAHGTDAVLVGAFLGYCLGAGCTGTFALWSIRSEPRRRRNRIWGAVRWLLLVSTFSVVVMAPLSLALRVSRFVTPSLPFSSGAAKDLASYGILACATVVQAFLFIGGLLAGRKIRDRGTPVEPQAPPAV